MPWRRKVHIELSLSLPQPHTHVLKPKVDPGSEEYVLEQLSSSEQKLVSLAEELSSRDLDTIHKEMADEEVTYKLFCVIKMITF